MVELLDALVALVYNRLKMEESIHALKLCFEIDVDDANYTKIRLYAVNAIKRLLGDA